jgi:hypothetical protein
MELADKPPGTPEEQLVMAVAAAAAGEEASGGSSGSGGSGRGGDKAGSEGPTECAFFMRTGTCAYGDRCRFAHPPDRPPPDLNSRGYPKREGGELFFLSPPFFFSFDEAGRRVAVRAAGSRRGGGW